MSETPCRICGFTDADADAMNESDRRRRDWRTANLAKGTPTGAASETAVAAVATPPVRVPLLLELLEGYRLGAALREALATVPHAETLEVFVWTLKNGAPSFTVSHTLNDGATTAEPNEATRALAALLAARTPTPETEER
jgi:hypothetical protein